ncbi:MAG: YcaO-like family protein [Myxococcales bacterium]
MTLARMRPLMPKLGITRIASITGLDRIGVPVVSVHRPNSRSLAVSQGKGATLIAAQVSGLMESIEGHHAEHINAPLFIGSHREVRERHAVVEVESLPRLATSSFHADLPMLWIAGTDLGTGKRLLVPYEMVHLDFRLPLPTGSGAFLMSSNGLASGNHMLEAISHAICELVERDANTLWHLSGAAAQSERRLDLASVDDDTCRSVIERFDRANVDVLVWDTTSDLGLCSFLCTILERDSGTLWPAEAVAGSGCHPRRSIALLRALTEAAQGRLTNISGARDDLSGAMFDERQARAREESLRVIISKAPRVAFRDTADVAHDDFDADVQWQLQRLAAAGLSEAIAVNLTRPELQVPVVRMIVPGLESMSELRGFVPGRRARRAMARLAQ